MGRGRRDKVHLSPEQRQRLEDISRNGYAPAKKILHAQILLMCDEGAKANRNSEPLVCMDEAAIQLKGHIYEPIPVAPGHDAKEDYHYTREGVQALFMFFNPIAGWRRVSNRDHRTRVDWAQEVRQLWEVDYPKARKIKLLCDNLNTHNIASLYEAFPALEAHRLARRLEIYHTPRNGSWLNVAEIELSVLAQQCLDRRISSVEKLSAELTAWQKERNRTTSKVVWQFTTEDARIKLKHLYPVFETSESEDSNAPF